MNDSYYIPMRDMENLDTTNKTSTQKPKGFFNKLWNFIKKEENNNSNNNLNKKVNENVDDKIEEHKDSNIIRSIIS